MPGEVIGPNREAIAVVLLSGHEVPIQLPSEYHAYTHRFVRISVLVREVSFCEEQQ